MIDRSNSQSFVPDFNVRLNGTALAPAVLRDIVAVEVQQDVDLPGMFTIQMLNWDTQQRRITWSDEQLFAPGAAVEIQMGYVNRLETVIAGEITGLEPEFVADAAPTLTVRGYDRSHRLMRGRNTRSFTRHTDSAIAGQIAQQHGLSAKTTDTGVNLEYVLQHNQTDWEFLQARANRIGYEVRVEDRTLLFRPHQHAAAPLLALQRDANLLEFRPRLTTMGQAGKLEVRGWSVQNKASFVSTASESATTMGGNISGPAAASTAFGQSSATRVDLPVLSQAEADRLASGQFDTLELDYITASGLCAGRTDLRVGTVISVSGMGRRFSGNYYVSATTHSYTPRRGYRTAFEVRRNAS